MRKLLVIGGLTALVVSGCAGDGGNVRVGGSIGSFGSSGGVSVGGSTSVGGGHKNPAPFEQLWLQQDVVDAVFPDEQLPFTATEEQVQALNSYAKSDAEPALNESEQEIVSRCRSGKARCRINLASAQGEQTD